MKLMEFLANPTQLALLILDVQNEFTSPKGKFPGIAKTLEQSGLISRLRSLKDAVLESGGMVIYVNTGFKPDYSDCPKHHGLLSGIAWLGVLKLGEWGTQTAEQLEPMKHPREFTIYKNTSNGFHGTQLDELLTKHLIQSLIITGMDTCFCVESTFRAAVDRDYKIIVPQDCLASALARESEIIVRLFRLMGALVTDSSKLIHNLKQAVKR